MHSTTHARSTAMWLLSVIAITALVAACAQPPGQATPTPGGGGPTAEPGTAALVIDSDTVLGPKNLTEDEKPTKTCIQANRFAHNEQVVWRVKVIDGGTGQAMDDKALTSVEVKLPDQTIALKYGGHPGKEPVDFFWTTSWVVPEGYPSGSLNYTIVATANDGRSATWEQFKVTFAMLQITDEVREVIATPVPTATP